MSTTRALARAEWRGYRDRISKQLAGRRAELDGVGHSILAPRDIRVEEAERGFVAIEIVAVDGTVETLRFREPLLVEQAEEPRAARRRT